MGMAVGDDWCPCAQTLSLHGCWLEGPTERKEDSAVNCLWRFLLWLHSCPLSESWQTEENLLIEETASLAPNGLLPLTYRKKAGKMVRWSACFAGLWIQVWISRTHAQLSVVTCMCKHSTPWEIGRGNSKARELGVCSDERWRRDLSQNRRISTQACTLTSTHTWCDTHTHAHTQEPVFTYAHEYTYIPRHACTTHTQT